ncbi:uncharacterized protein LMH87_007608 [Akanthomyces muscarius]|uniref:Uncharacterized protein n=1 Tax=Akanthomyces muscarius TaxID=2231603 RepID=A0A9W8UPZ2_AKAMU|nr:uncharacterized protein LMH87_007608 [Akanthomyces muscarius]KAJ4161577.1 hypothetical protein LMH87_007608 [Akanthomyces muscarius]
MRFAIVTITATLASSVTAIALPSLLQRTGQAQGDSVHARVTAISRDLSGNRTPDKEIDVPLGTLIHVTLARVVSHVVDWLNPELTIIVYQQRNNKP